MVNKDKELVKIIFVYSDGSSVESKIYNSSDYQYPKDFKMPTPMFSNGYGKYCFKCGIDLEKATHYCCPVYDCPSQFNVTC